MNNKEITTFRTVKKGQFFSYDAIVAGVLFILLLTILYNYWNSLRNTISIRIEDVSRTAISVSNLLLTPGYPQNWNYTNFNQIGLLESPNSIVISESKFANLSLLFYSDYSLLKERLGVGPYEILINIGNEEIGIRPINAVSSVQINRPVIYKGRLENLSITIWSS